MSFSAPPQKTVSAGSSPDASVSAPTPPGGMRAADRTTWLERLGFACGQLPFQFGASGLNAIAYPIYNMTLSMSPTLIGAVLAISRIWDGLTDPVIGSVSDNFRSPWGRRRPFVALGAVLCALTFPIIWFVPTSWHGAWAFSYFLITALVFFTAFTVYAVPYLTLGYEMSSDSNERVRIHTVRAVVSKLTIFIFPWIYAIAQWPVFKSTVDGMRTLGIIIGALFILLALPAVLLTRETFAKQAAAQQKVPLLQGLKLTFHNRPFIYLIGIVVGLLLANNVVNYLGIYINSYYVFAGDTVKGAALHAKAQTLFAIAGIVTVPFVSRLATRYGKLRIIRWCIGCGILASISEFFFYSRAIPELQYLSMLLLSPSFSGFWVLVDPMKADTADYDERATGLRREGMYAAVSCWVEKVTLSIALFLFGMILDLTGFDVALGGAQDERSLLVIRLLFAGLPAVFLAGSLIFALRYPLSDERVRSIRDELEQQRAAKAVTR